jgi:hypothetical protein
MPKGMPEGKVPNENLERSIELAEEFIASRNAAALTLYAKGEQLKEAISELQETIEEMASSSVS